jgi:hypothetical protein
MDQDHENNQNDLDVIKVIKALHAYLTAPRFNGRSYLKISVVVWCSPLYHRLFRGLPWQDKVTWVVNMGGFK